MNKATKQILVEKVLHNNKHYIIDMHSNTETKEFNPTLAYREFFWA